MTKPQKRTKQKKVLFSFALSNTITPLTPCRTGDMKLKAVVACCKGKQNQKQRKPPQNAETGTKKGNSFVCSKQVICEFVYSGRQVLTM